MGCSAGRAVGPALVNELLRCAGGALAARDPSCGLEGSYRLTIPISGGPYPKGSLGYNAHDNGNWGVELALLLFWRISGILLLSRAS